MKQKLKYKIRMFCVGVWMLVSNVCLLDKQFVVMLLVFKLFEILHLLSMCSVGWWGICNCNSTFKSVLIFYFVFSGYEKRNFFPFKKSCL